jgi:hypothetical protein
MGMSGQRYNDFLDSLAVTTPTEGDKFARLDESGATQVSTWKQMYQELDLRYTENPDGAFVSSLDVRSIVRLTQAEYDALGTTDATALYLIVT